MGAVVILTLVGLVGYSEWNNREKSVDYFVAHPEEARGFNKQCRLNGMPVFSTEAKTHYEKNCMTVNSAIIVLQLQEK